MEGQEMEFKELGGGFSVCGQLAPADLALVAERGYCGIICNRPDGEADGQPSFAQMQSAAKDHGISMVYVPISPKGVGMEDVQSFRSALDNLPGPILAYCRSGARSGAMFEAARQLARS